ncbi:MAG TPA: hypothetical protein VL625_02625 [Patescibacteria group bacterium]|nr:hypothetical protein [Patescibacteria group bacterium]
MTSNLYYVSVGLPPPDTGHEQEMGDIFHAAVGAFPNQSLVYAGISLCEHGRFALAPGEKPFDFLTKDEQAAVGNLVALYSDSAAADGFYEFLNKRVVHPEHFPVKKGAGIPIPK